MDDEQLAEKAAAVKERVYTERKDPARSSEVPESQVCEEQATCIDCKGEFTRSYLEINGERVPGLTPIRCESCSVSDDEPPAPTSEAAQREQSSEKHLDKAGVNVRRHGRCTLERGLIRGVHFDTTECGEEPLIEARQFLDDTLHAGRWGAVRGLLLMGTLGSGKTHLAAAIVRAALLSPRVKADSVIFDRADRLITMVQDTYGTGKTSAILEARERAHLLVIDDLGREKATPDTLRILVDLINARESHPTVITSNYTPEGLVSRWEGNEGWKRLASRLGPRNYRHVTVLGSDRRNVA